MFFPDEYVASTYVIPFEELYEKGYRGVLFDIDNTLVPHGAPADERAKKLFANPGALYLQRPQAVHKELSKSNGTDGDR